MSIREHIEKDPALERRFQQVLVEEPSVEDTIGILRGIKEKYEAHHKVSIADSSARRRSNTVRPLHHRPGSCRTKRSTSMDESASRLRMEIDSSPVEVDDLQRAVDRLKMEEMAVSRER